MRQLALRFVLLVAIPILAMGACSSPAPQPPRVEEITFQSGEFTLVGDLRLPAGTGPFPVVLFVHGSGAANRTMAIPSRERTPGGRLLEQAGHPYSRVQVFPGSDHLLTVTETGCMRETGQMVEQVVRDQGYTSTNEFLQDPEQIPLSALPFVPGYLDLIEEWLRGLRP